MQILNSLKILCISTLLFDSFFPGSNLRSIQYEKIDTRITPTVLYTEEGDEDTSDTTSDAENTSNNVTENEINDNENIDSSSTSGVEWEIINSENNNINDNSSSDNINSVIIEEVTDFEENTENDVSLLKPVVNLLIIVSDTSVIRETDTVVSNHGFLYTLSFDTAQAADEAFAYYKDVADFIQFDTVLSADTDDDTDTSETENRDNTIEIIEVPIDEPLEIDTATEPIPDLDSDPIDVLNNIEEEANKRSAYSKFQDALSNEFNYTIALIDTGVDSDLSVYDAISVIGDDSADDNGHGSLMYSHITAMNPNAKVVSIKALNSHGDGSVASIYAAIEYAISKKVNIINLSLSAYKTAENSIIDYEIQKALDAGIIVVASAGNNNEDAINYTPANIPGVITIGASDEYGNKLANSNFGECVNYFTNADSSSEAAATISGFLSTQSVVNAEEATLVLDAKCLRDNFVAFDVDEKTEVTMSDEWFQKLLEVENAKRPSENGEYDLSDADDFSDAIKSKGLFESFNSLFKASSETTAVPHIEGFKYISTYTGTAVFDEGTTWNASTDGGKDFSQTDDVVRSYDNVFYRIGYSTVTDEYSTEVKKGSFYIEATLPYNASKAEWDIGAMPWIKNPTISTEDGKQILNGEINFDGGIMAPRVGVLNFIVIVHAPVNNGDTLATPTFKLSLHPFNESSSAEIHTATADKVVKVSAKPMLNASIKYLSQDAAGTVNWAVLLSLKNGGGSGRGIKGQGNLNSNEPIEINFNFSKKRRYWFEDTLRKCFCCR